MSEDTENLNAWEYSQGNWKKINDPADAFIEDGDDTHEGFRKMGYSAPDYIGDIDVGSFMLDIFSSDPYNHDLPVPEYRYLVQVEVAGSAESVYCPSLPDLLGLINLCSAGLTAALLTGVFKDNQEVLDVITRPARKQIDIERRERQAKREQREAQALARAKARRSK